MACVLCSDFECAGSRVAALALYPGCPVITPSGRYGKVRGLPAVGIHHWFVDVILSFTVDADGFHSSYIDPILDVNTVRVVTMDELPPDVRKIPLIACFR